MFVFFFLFSLPVLFSCASEYVAWPWMDGEEVMSDMGRVDYG